MFMSNSTKCLSESREFSDEHCRDTFSIHFMSDVFSHASVSEVIKEIFRGHNRGNHCNFARNFIFRFLEERQRRYNLPPQENEFRFFRTICGEAEKVVQGSSKLKKLRYFYITRKHTLFLNSVMIKLQLRDES